MRQCSFNIQLLSLSCARSINVTQITRTESSAWGWNRLGKAAYVFVNQVRCAYR